MLNRRQLRLKVVQAIYAFEQSGNDRMDIGEKELFKSLNEIDVLFVSQLSLLLELVNFSQLRMEEAKKKFLPTDEERNPSTRFVDNRVVAMLNENPGLLRKISVFKISWTEEQNLIRKLYQDVKSSDMFKEYLYAEKDGFQTDKQFLESLYLGFIAFNDDLQGFYEERKIQWSTDYDIVNNLILRYLKNIKEGSTNSATLPELFPVDTLDGNSEDRQFVKDLFRKTIINREAHTLLIAERTRNWEFDRIAVMDKLLLRMAVSEILLFPSIPIKVSLNEYIELSKIFSTPKSRIFINGVLDKMIDQLKAEKKIIKTGRGLLDK